MIEFSHPAYEARDDNLDIRIYVVPIKFILTDMHFVVSIHIPHDQNTHNAIGSDYVTFLSPAHPTRRE